MRVFKTTIPDLDRLEIDTSDLINLEVQIGTRVYQLSERDGGLRVSVDGQLVVMPVGANMMVLAVK